MNGKFYRCGGEGHRSFECKSYGENIGRNIVIQGQSKQVSENLMVRRILCNKEVNKECVLRRIIFMTTCKIEKKCCKMIIDSGSSTNLASDWLQRCS